MRTSTRAASGGGAGEVRFRTVGHLAGGSGHAHAGRPVLVPIVGVKRTVFRPATGGHALVNHAVQEADGIVASHELLVQSRVFVVDAGVDHGDHDTFAADAKVPCPIRVHGGRTGFDRRSLHIAPKHQLSVRFNHHDIVEGPEFREN
jgi:hypothetical protein